MSSTVDPFLLVLTLVMTILLIIANIYIVAHYSHAVDSAFSSSMACKFVIVTLI
jgi:LMBR1 domain-containing protein 1